MLTALLAIVDRLIELVKAKQAERSNFFQKIIEPSFAELLMVHGDYVAMFTKVLEMLSVQAESASELQREKALQVLRERRLKLEAVREELRALERVTESERHTMDTRVYAFLDALSSYLFIGADADVRSMARAGTAASDLISVLEREDSILLARDRCQEILTSLRQHWSLVCEAYVGLKLALAKAGGA